MKKVKTCMAIVAFLEIVSAHIFILLPFAKFYRHNTSLFFKISFHFLELRTVFDIRSFLFFFVFFLSTRFIQKIILLMRQIRTSETILTTDAVFEKIRIYTIGTILRKKRVETSRTIDTFKTELTLHGIKHIHG